MSEQVPEDFRAGSLVAGYRLEERIGLGGMAVVFRAYDSRLDRRVALKILAPGLAADQAFRQRFIRESRAAAAVEDPHIIPVFEAGESGGVLFIAMRYVRGGDVRSLIDRSGTLPPGRAAEIISQVAGALDAAHERGLVHRDVKPGNMLLEASAAADRPEHVYLSDFGLSKAALAAGGDLTATGQFLGTLDYVAPEQIESRPLDGRTDEYALACSAFEMLCGEPPFRREQSVSVMYAHLSEPPPLIRSLRPGLPAAVDDVLAKGMAKAPSDRYASCRGFALALREALRGAAESPAAEAGHPATQIATPPGTGSAPGGNAAAGSAEGGAAAGRRQDEGPAGDGEPAGNDGSLGDGGSARDGGSRESSPAHDAPARAAGPPPLTEPAGFRPPARGGLTEQAGDPAERQGWPAGWTGSAGSRPDGERAAAGGPRASQPPPGARQPDAGPAALLAESGGHGRPWWRSPVPVAGIVVLALLVAAGGYLLSHGGHANASHGSGTGTTALALPGCTQARATAPPLTSVRTSATALPGAPFGAAVTASNQNSLVTTGDAVAVLRNGPGLTTTLLRSVPAHGANKGIALTPDGHYAVAADGSGAVVINVDAAVSGTSNPVMGFLTSPNGSGAVEVLITSDGNYAFVTLQGSGQLAVFNLKAALTNGISRHDFLGYIPVAAQPVGMSTDGRWLYVASLAGWLTVLSLHAAETDRAHAVIGRVKAGCQPARAILSGNHQIVWVTARGSDALLAFSAAKLRNDPKNALLARVMVGETPLGETFVDGGALIMVVDSNLNGLKGVPSNVAVVSTASALSRKNALLGYLAVGAVPRQFAVEPGGTVVLVTVQSGHQLEAINVGGLRDRAR